MLGEMNVNRSVVENAMTGEFDFRIKLVLKPLGNVLMVRARRWIHIMHSVDNLVPSSVIGIEAIVLVVSFVVDLTSIDMIRPR